MLSFFKLKIKENVMRKFLIDDFISFLKFFFFFLNFISE